MSDMKLIMENWKKFSKSQEEEINEIVDPATAAALGALAIALLRPGARVTAEPGGIAINVGSRISAVSLGLKELMAMAGLGALASGNVGEKIKLLWNKLRGGAPEAAEEVADSLDDVSGADGPDPEALQAFLDNVGHDPAVEEAVANLLQLVEAGGATEEEIQVAVDAANEAIQAAASDPEASVPLTLRPAHAGMSAVEPSGQVMYAKNKKEY